MIHHPQLAHKIPYDIRIWQCTDFDRHWHSNTEVYICLQGQMKICIEGTMYRLHPEDAVFVASNEAHEIFCDVPDTRVILIAFGYGLLGSNYSEMQNSFAPIPFFNLQDDRISPQIRQPLLQIRQVLCRPEENGVLADWKLRSSLYAVAAYLTEHKQIKPVSAERMVRAKQLEKMYGTLQYIADNFHRSVTVEQAAAVAGYDKSYFCKQFRKTTGMTFHRYLNYYRVSAACRLLANTKLSVCAVAEQAGFPSQKNLSRLFHQMLGMTPTQYRKLPPEEKSSIKPL